jgi:hypothetical protein
MIEALWSFIPYTDHHVILTSTVLIPPPHLNGLSILPDDIPLSVYAPCFRQPPLLETFHLKQFSTLADNFMEDHPDIPSQISGDSSSAFMKSFLLSSILLHHSPSHPHHVILGLLRNLLTLPFTLSSRNANRSIDFSLQLIEMLSYQMNHLHTPTSMPFTPLILSLITLTFTLEIICVASGVHYRRSPM